MAFLLTFLFSFCNSPAGSEMLYIPPEGKQSSYHTYGIVYTYLYAIYNSNDPVGVYQLSNIKTINNCAAREIYIF